MDSGAGISSGLTPEPPRVAVDGDERRAVKQAADGFGDTGEARGEALSHCVKSRKVVTSDERRSDRQDDGLEKFGIPAFERRLFDHVE